MTELTPPEDPIAELEKIAYAHCASFEYEVPDPYFLFVETDCDTIWCPYTGAIAVCVDDDMQAVRIHKPEFWTRHHGGST